MTATSKPVPGTIVIAYDGSQHAEQAMNWAAEQADREQRTLTIVHVVRPATLEFGSLAVAHALPDDMREAIRKSGRALMSGARARALESHPALEVATVLGEGDPRQILIGLSEEATCLVLGSRGRGRVASLLLGSVSVAVSRHASCPVVVVRPFHPGKVRNGILVGTDAGAHTRSTLEFAYRQASLLALPLTVMYCVPDLNDPDLPVGAVDDDLPGLEEHRCALAESVAGMAEKFPDVRARLRLAKGTAELCLIGASPSLDLVVVGRHHIGAADLLGLGSFATSVVEGASCPVAVVCEGVPAHA
jgi:nucleotide-binding universal stress UspA family protein